MKNVLVMLAATLMLLFGISCGDGGGSAEGPSVANAGQQEPIFRSIPPKEAKALMESRKDLLLIDVRGPEEMREGYIAGSRLIPIAELARGRMSLPAGNPLLLICAVGGRSYAVGQYFSRKGYPEIYNLQGGISAWKEAGLPLKH